MKVHYDWNFIIRNKVLKIYHSLNVHPSQQFVQFFFLDWRSLQILLIKNLFVLFFRREFIVRFEQIDTVNWTTGHQFKVYWMELDLLDFFLALMQEHQLVRNFRVFFLVLHWHVPNRKAVVLACHCDHWFFVWLESDGSDWLIVPVETQQFLAVVIFTHSQIPYLHQSVITTCNNQVLGNRIPVSHIHILVMRLDFKLWFFGLIDSHVHDLQSSIRRTWHKTKCYMKQTQSLGRERK